MKSLSRVRLLATPWTAAYQAPPSMGFSRQEYWSGVPLPSPEIMLCIDKVHATAAEINFSLSDFCHPDILVTWQMSAPNSEELRWVRNSCKLNSWALGNSSWLLGSSWIPGKLHFSFDGLQLPLTARLMPSQWQRNYWKINVFSTWGISSTVSLGQFYEP